MATVANTSAEQLRTVQGNDATLAAPAVNLATNTGSPTPAVQYGYCDPSSGSRLASMTYPNGRVLYYDYQYTALDNAIGRVGFIADDDGPGQTEGTPLVKYSYLGLSTVVGEADANGVTETTTLDDFGRTAEIKYVGSGTSGTVTDDFQYGYDYDGNVLYKDNLVNANLSEVYAYDGLNRLTSYQQGLITAFNSDGTATIAAPAQSQTFGYDALGNQLSVTTNSGTPVSSTFNSQNEMTTNGCASLTYDNNGNTLTDSSGDHYTYDAWNHEIAVTNSSSVELASYSYDANGNRISQTEAGNTTDFYLSSQGQTLEERQGTTVTAQNVWGITYVNDLVQRTEGTSVYFIQHDANFNTVAVTDANGNVIERYTYLPYGTVTVLNADGSVKGDGTIAASTVDMPYLFQGERLDPATGEDHDGVRDENPPTGTWNRPDPAGIGMNSYQFAMSDPIMGTDPTGYMDNTPPWVPIFPGSTPRLLTDTWTFTDFTATYWCPGIGYVRHSFYGEEKTTDYQVKLTKEYEIEFAIISEVDGQEVHDELGSASIPIEGWYDPEEAILTMATLMNNKHLAFSLPCRKKYGWASRGKRLQVAEDCNGKRSLVTAQTGTFDLWQGDWNHNPEYSEGEMEYKGGGCWSCNAPPPEKTPTVDDVVKYGTLEQ